MKRLFLLSQALIILFVFSGEADAQSYELRGGLREWVKVFTQSPNELDIAETRLKLELLSTVGENTAFKVKGYGTYEAISKEHLELHQDATQQIANTGTWVSFGNNPSSIFNVPCTVTSQQQFYVKNDSGGDLTLQLEIVTNHNFVGNDSIALLTGSSVTYTKVT